MGSRSRAKMGASCCILVLLLVNSCVGLKYIERTWDGQHLNRSDIVHFTINESSKMDGVEINIEAPFYDDPAPPGGKPGEAYFGLWDYEVVECFFVSQELLSKEPDYL